MRTATAACAALAWAILTPPVAEAGFLMTFAREAGKPPARMLIDRHALRVEEGAEVIIYRRDKNLLWNLNAKERSYAEVTEADLRNVGQTMQGAMQQLKDQMKDMSPEERQFMERMMGDSAKAALERTAPAKVAYRKLASGQKVGKWTCDRYEMTLDGKKEGEMCFARAASIGLGAEEARTLEAFFAFMAQAARQMGAAVLGMKLPGGANEPPGIPVETTSARPGQPPDHIEVTELKRQAFPASLFEVPAGFKKETAGR